MDEIELFIRARMKEMQQKSKTYNQGRPIRNNTNNQSMNILYLVPLHAVLFVFLLCFR